KGWRPMQTTYRLVWLAPFHSTTTAFHYLRDSTTVTELQMQKVTEAMPQETWLTPEHSLE
ncbi:hypothetical protein, partial [Escherichia coli]|uniref:hypothetical protein n=1 Tax=Escherichia coli TaxID=562 RepID=UPI00195DC0EB